MLFIVLIISWFQIDSVRMLLQLCMILITKERAEGFLGFPENKDCAAAAGVEIEQLVRAKEKWEQTIEELLELHNA